MPSNLIDRSPTDSADHQQLTAMGRTIAIRCPDMQQMARDTAISILRQHKLDGLEPDTVYWHRFDRSVSSPRTFSGWQHLCRPVESLTLPQLVMRRFIAEVQDAPDVLQLVSGFYTAGPEGEVFNETNEVRLLPKDVMQAFWQIDFKTRFTEKMRAFWKDCANDYRTLTKATFLAKALEDRQSGTLSPEQFDSLLNATGFDIAQPISLAMLRASTPVGKGVQIRTLDIAGYEASDILRIVEPGGRQFLYTPGEADAFHVFQTPKDLHWWLLRQTDQTSNRARFMTHFPLSSHGEGDQAVGLFHTMDLMFTTWDSPAHDVINRNDHLVKGDPFTYLRDAARTRMEADATFALYANSELRKQMWLGYLRAFTKLFAPMAPFGWPVALAVVGAGIADVGLSIDQAIHGHTSTDRRNGVIAAILGSIDVLFNSLFLLPAAGASLPEITVAEETTVASTPISEPPTVARAPEMEASAPAPVEPVEEAHALTPFETAESLAGYPEPATQGRMRGVYLKANGETYVSIDNRAYRVRFVNELDSWVIVDPGNPFSFYRNLPVRMDADGQWQPTLKGQLLGGGKVHGRLQWGHAAARDPITDITTPYDMPQALREPLRSVIEDPSNKPFEGYGNVDGEPDPVDDLLIMRDRLLRDADEFFTECRLPERPEIPTIPAGALPKAAIRLLYADSPGLVIGESHSEVGSKQFLIDNMKQLAKQDVRTLYMEHLLTDLHQADLDTFARTGRMPEKLKAYLKALDAGQHTDPSGTYTFLNVVKVANSAHMRIRAIDCMSSYRVANLPDLSGNVRTRMMNYFACTVIRADQAVTGEVKWVALVGNSHANTYKGIPGLAELEGVIGLRIEDIPLGKKGGFAPDPGQAMDAYLGRPGGAVKCDLKLQMEVRGTQSTPASAGTFLESRLQYSGDFLIRTQGNVTELVHRTRGGTIIHTPIHVEGDHLYVVRAKWPNVSQRRFNGLGELTAALKLIGMTQRS